MSLVPEVFCDRCGFCHPDHEDWRALLARDVADVVYHLPELEHDAEFSAHYPTQDRLFREVEDLQAWLTRARAALDR